jgi:putative transposon-encoded protein
VQPLCVVNTVSVTTAAAVGATTLAVRPTTVTLPAGSVLPFTGNNQVTLSAAAPAGSTSLSVNPIGAAIAANAAAIAACPDGTRSDLYRTDVARYRSLANATDPTGKGQLNAVNQFAVTAGQAYRASATLEVESYTSGTFQASVAWFDSGGVEIGANVVASQNAAAATRNTSSAVVTAPVGAVKGAMRYEWTGGGQGLAYADGLLLVPDALHGTLSDTPGNGATPEWGAQRIIDFSTNPPSLLGTYRSPSSGVWPPPTNGIYTPRLTKMLGNDIGFTTWMSDGLRVLDLRHPATPKLVASYVPPAVNDPAGGAGAGGGLSRGQVWPNQPLVTGVDVKPTGPNTGYVFVSDINAGLYALSYSIVRAKAAVADFDASGASDIAVFRPSNGTSYVQGGATTNFGTSGDLPVPGNYSGSTTTDTAVFRPSTGTWYVNGGATVNFGTSGDLPVPGDYDGNGITDRAVFRPSTGTWYVDGGTALNFGTSGDIPVPGDYDGDGKTDMAVFRPSTGTWYVNGGATVNFGTSGDIPVPGDYNGDGKTDMAVFRPSTGTWYVNGGAVVNWGTSGDIPVPGDFNGDGTTDMAVFRPSTGTWYVNGGAVVNWGTSGDIPLELPSAIRQAFFP